MVIVENLVGLLPPYLIFTLFLAFIIWSKFYRKGAKRKKLDIKNIDEILEIARITIVLLIFLWSSSFFFIAVTNLFEFTSIFETGISYQDQILAAGIYMFLLLLTYKTSDAKRKDLKKGFLALVLIYFLVLNGYFFGMYLASSDAQLIFKWKISQLIVITTFAGILLWVFGGNLFLTDKDVRKQKEGIIHFFKKNLRNLVFLVIIFVIISGLSFLVFHWFQPKLNFVDKINDYKLDTYDYDMATENFNREFYIQKMGSDIPFTLNYSDFDLIDSGTLIINYNEIGVGEVRNKSNEISLNKDEKKYTEYGIIDYIFHEPTKVLYIKFDKEKLSQKGVYGFELKGRRNRNISSDFIISKGDAPDCSRRNCTVNLTFSNKLNSRVYGERVRFFGNRPIFYGEKCTLHGGVIEETFFNELMNSSQTKDSSVSCTLESKECNLDGLFFQGRLITNIKNYFVPVRIIVNRNLRNVNLSLKISCQS